MAIFRVNIWDESSAVVNRHHESLSDFLIHKVIPTAPNAFLTHLLKNGSVGNTRNTLSSAICNVYFKVNLQTTRFFGRVSRESENCPSFASVGASGRRKATSSACGFKISVRRGAETWASSRQENQTPNMGIDV